MLIGVVVVVVCCRVAAVAVVPVSPGAERAQKCIWIRIPGCAQLMKGIDESIAVPYCAVNSVSLEPFGCYSLCLSVYITRGNRRCFRLSPEARSDFKLLTAHHSAS